MVRHPWSRHRCILQIGSGDTIGAIGYMAALVILGTTTTAEVTTIETLIRSYIGF